MTSDKGADGKRAGRGKAEVKVRRMDGGLEEPVKEKIEKLCQVE